MNRLLENLCIHGLVMLSWQAEKIKLAQANSICSLSRWWLFNLGKYIL